MEFISRAKAKKQMKLSRLGAIGASSKVIKNQKVSNNYTYILYLAPSDTSGYNVCLHSTPECRLGCLATSGRAKIESLSGKSIIHDARVKKTHLLYENQEFFMKWLIEELKAAQSKAKRDGFEFSVRLNGTSDIEWEHIKIYGMNIFELFPEVQFYDYTKNAGRMLTKMPENYHLTFSFNGKNEYISKKILSKGKNVAVIFNLDKKESFPETWHGYKVINGDLTDYRPNDGYGVVVGLHWKNIANKEVNQQIKNSKFVVQRDAESIKMNQVKISSIELSLLN